MAEEIENIQLLQQGLGSGADASLNGSLDIPPPTVETESVSAVAVISASAGAPSSEKQAEEAWRRENWLLAGMQDIDQLRDSDGEDETDSDGDLPPRTGSSEHWLLLADEAAQAQPSKENADEKIDLEAFPDQVVNPLEGFMADWLDPELTSSVSRETGTDHGEALAAMQISDTSLGALPSTQPMAREIFGLPSDVSARRGPARSNPYADGLLDVSESAANPGFEPGAVDRSNPTLMPAAPPPGSTPITAPAEVEKPRREPWRPPEKDDEKYFRRLNRF